jgi:hypothetical protein
MKKLVVVATAFSSVLWFSQARAESTERVTTTGPNRSLLRSGFFTLGVPYVASVIVAATSDRSYDKNLYVPVAGPWMDLVDRESCGTVMGPPCDRETVYKVLLVTSGILQGIGALEIVGSFVFPETRTVTYSAGPKPVVMMAPYASGNSYGLAALARF